MSAYTAVPERTVDLRSNEDLARLSAAGDMAAREVLGRRLDEHLPHWVRRWSSSTVWRDDLANAAKQQILAELAKFDRARGSFNTWAYKVAYHAVIDKVRELHLNKKEVSYDVMPEGALLTVTNPAETYADDRVKEEVDELPKEQATIIQMKFYQMLSIEVIARKLHLSRKQVRLRLQKAMVTLRRRLVYTTSTSHGPISLSGTVSIYSDQ
jgi:RNA polymerase sigma-70 factor, ECF subfamily